MSKIIPAALIAVLGIAAWLALKANYKLRRVRRRFLGIWHKNPSLRETAILGSALIASCVIFATLPGLLL